MFWDTYQQLANEALKEVAMELGVFDDLGRGFGWFQHSTPLQDGSTADRFCSDFEDSRGQVEICVPNGLSDEETKERIKQQIRAHGIVPVHR